MPSYAAAICSPVTSSSNGACQPPNGKPSGSSSGPPGACPTRSRVANSSMSMPMEGGPTGARRLIGAGFLTAVHKRSAGWSAHRPIGMIEHVFEQQPTPSLLDDGWLRDALAELTDRWRAAADGDEPVRRTTEAAARLTASLEAGALQVSEVRAAQAVIGAHEARRARAIAAFCRTRPASLDRPDCEIGAAAAATRAARPSALAAVSEWAVDEIAVALSLTESSASRIVVLSLHLVDRLPGTLAALEQGALTWEHARVMGEVVAPSAMTCAALPRTGC